MKQLKYYQTQMHKKENFPQRANTPTTYLVFSRIKYSKCIFNPNYCTFWLLSLLVATVVFFICSKLRDSWKVGTKLIISQPFMVILVDCSSNMLTYAYTLPQAPLFCPTCEITMGLSLLLYSKWILSQICYEVISFIITKIQASDTGHN